MTVRDCFVLYQRKTQMLVDLLYSSWYLSQAKPAQQLTGIVLPERLSGTYLLCAAQRQYNKQETHSQIMTTTTTLAHSDIVLFLRSQIIIRNEKALSDFNVTCVSLYLCGMEKNFLLMPMLFLQLLTKAATGTSNSSACSNFVAYWLVFLLAAEVANSKIWITRWQALTNLPSLLFSCYLLFISLP